MVVLLLFIDVGFFYPILVRYNKSSKRMRVLVYLSLNTDSTPRSGLQSRRELIYHDTNTFSRAAQCAERNTAIMAPASSARFPNSECVRALDSNRD